MKIVFILLIGLLAAVQPLLGQEPAAQDCEIVTLPAGGRVVLWQGHPGRTYFVQVSSQAEPLARWTWAPIIESGNGGPISHDIGGTAARAFFRLHYTDTPKPEGVSFEAWDIDRDGLSNSAEISTTPQTDPLKADSDGDGLPDGWELANGLNPVDDASAGGSYGWNADADGDGASNGREFEEQTQANDASSFPPVFWSVRNQMHAWSNTISSNPETVQVTTLKMPWSGGGYAEEQEGSHIEPETIGQMVDGMPPFPETLAEAIQAEVAVKGYDLDTKASSSLSLSHNGGAARSADFVETRNWIRVPASSTPRDFHFLKITEVKTVDRSTGEILDHVVTVASKETLTVPANQTDSSSVDLLPLSPPVGDGLIKIATTSLIHLEHSPEVLPVNSDFDEGRIDPATDYAIPDCDDVPGVDQKSGAGNHQVELDAVRDHLDAKHLQGDDVVEDLHRGWFGARPDALDKNLWEGATVTLRKIDRIDPDTGRQESGQVRFYAKWADGYYGIDAYDFLSLQPVNLVTGGVHGRSGEGVYGPTSTIPSGATFYMEGVRPGKITLEWRFQKGEIDVKHEQTFKVETRQAVDKWREEIRYQIRLQTKVKTGTEVDVALYLPGNGFRRTDTFNQPPEWENTPRVRAIYYYYRQLFTQMPEKFMWAGMAKTAAAPIYAGMSDLTTLWQVQEAAGGYGAGTYFLTRGLLCGGQKAIFTDMAWAHRAYLGSGIEALNWVENENDDAANFDAWRTLDMGIKDSDQTQVNDANTELLRREQRDIVQEYYYDFATTKWMHQPKSGVGWIDSSLSWLLGFEVVTEDGTLGANVGKWLSANSKKNPLPGGPSFHDVVPNGQIDAFNDRWAWTSNAANGMLQIWTGAASDAAAPKFDATQRLSENQKLMYSAAIPYSHDPGGLPNIENP